jgi:hypothetical protein
MSKNLVKEREEVINYVSQQLMGPVGGRNEKLYNDLPHHRYLVGVLFPQDAEKSQANESINDENNPSSDSDKVDDSPMSAVFQRLPASIGLSFYVENTKKLKISVWGASYEQGSELIEKEVQKNKKTKKFWERKLINDESDPEVIYIEKNDKIKNVLNDKAEIYSNWRTLNNGFLVTVNLINKSKVKENEKIESNDCLFQVGFKCEAVSGEIKDYPNISSISHDEEEQDLTLQYKDNIQYAIGHGCSATWGYNKNKKYFTQTTWIPQHTIKDFKFDIETKNNLNFLSLNFLANKDTKKKDLINGLISFLKLYEIWFENLKTQKVDSKFKETKNRITNKIKITINRIQEGINLLENNNEVFRSFKLANEAMLRQMVYSKISSNNNENSNEKIQPNFFSDDYKDLQWRPFQLAFQLLVIESLVNKDSSYRDTVDLIWFPTGGGKTESYLALAAFELIYRRVKYKEQGFGTGVIKRYTLRLLAAQQLQRAATLISALELMRKEHIDTLLSEPFTLGFWVGGATTPNRYSNNKKSIWENDLGAKERLDEALESEEPINHFQLLNCPICNSRIFPESREEDEKKYGVRATESSFKFFCPSENCDLHENIPVSVIDEDIYKKPPSFVIGTIDKFARLAWDGSAATLFGTENTKPPYLVIQDELHLISGPLGTIAGIYEAAISTIIKSKEMIEPKYIAATATIRRSKQQIESLYGNEVNIFPPPGLSNKDSFFAKVNEDSPGRLFVGFMPQGQTSPITSLIHVSAALSQSVYDSELKNEDLKDSYWTQVIYHNSKRELGKTITLCNDDIPSRIKVVAKFTKDDKRRKLSNIEELSGTKIAYEIPKILSRLEKNYKDPEMIDILPCTNMISVGVDVPRLGLMLINGQPKTTSEYIQASSRVGRHEKRPGIVVTCYSPNKPRDRSHYENFVSYHDSIYKYVEPTSVTPFSPQAMERAMHAAQIIVMRHAGGLRDNDKAKNFNPDNAQQKKIINLLSERIGSAAHRESASTKEYLNLIIKEWKDFIDKSDAPINFDSKDGRQKKSLLIHYDKKDQLNTNSDFWPRATLNSMRNVDSESKIKIRTGVPGVKEKAFSFSSPRKIRRSQYISPHGVGAIYDIGNESLIAPDISWFFKNYGLKIKLDRLTNNLPVKELRMPVPDNFENSSKSIPFFRFPRWLFCSSCRSLRKESYDLGTANELPKCEKCKSKKVLTPMRFVAVCNKGHLQDIDWFYFLHGKANIKENNCNNYEDSSLRFKTLAKRGAGLHSIIISCDKCEQTRSLQDMYEGSLGPCQGKQPWEPNRDRTKCEEKLDPIGRSASNLYYPKVVSALDIPVERNEDTNPDEIIIQNIKSNENFVMFLKIYNISDLEKKLIDTYIEEIMKEVPGATPKLIESLYSNQQEGKNEDNREIEIDEEKILKEEWEVLKDPVSNNKNFISEETSFKGFNSYGLDKLIDKVILIKKLREVRVLTGFNRKLPSKDNLISVGLNKKIDWMPASEVYGEGIFISFSNKEISKWEEKNNKVLSKRLNSMKQTHQERQLQFLPEPSNKFVLLHTFSHILIRQLSFECGYGSSSLRERIYCDESNMSGILIYTADSDTEGSLGGLIRQGKPDLFIPTTLTAIEKSCWCSSDPICKEIAGQGMMGLNKAACHSCALLSETSCIAHNALLDRMLLIGEENDKNFGFFNSVLNNFLGKIKS